MRAVALSAIPLLAVASTVAADEAKPVFKPTSIKGNFVEQFTDDWSERWTVSEATKKTPVGSETFAYVGNWAVEDGEPVLIEGDKGLVAKSKAAHHAISAPFPKPVDFGTQPLVVQYEVKYQKGGNCGGGYVKLLEDGFQTSGKEFDDKTPWVVMFGPDLTCPGTKVHFIFRHKNPITGEYEEKHLKSAPTPSINSETNLYTLAVFPNQTYEVFFNGKSQSTGSLLEDFSPAVNPDKEIDDPSDSKPSDWVDEKRITDPEAIKPEDWDEEAPYEIVDEEATKPEGWLDNEPEMIPDPDSEKPEEWDDEEDGDWVAPMIRNPKCDDAPGCGEWKRPNKPNPAYKGKWFAPMIDNPAYVGEWAPRKVANPAFFEDNTPTKSLNKIGGVGIELWTMTEDILFDNIYVGHSLEDAQKLAAETYEVKHTVEDTIKPVETPLDEPAAALPSFQENPVGFVRQKVLNFVDAAKANPVDAVKSQPETAGALAAGLFTLFGMLGATLGLLGGSAAPVTKSTKKNNSTLSKDAANKTATVKLPAGETVPTTTITDKKTGETVTKRK